MLPAKLHSKSHLVWALFAPISHQVSNATLLLCHFCAKDIKTAFCLFAANCPINRPQNHYLAQSGLELLIPPASTSNVLGFQVYTFLDRECSARDRTLGLVYARQAYCLLSYNSKFFLLFKRLLKFITWNNILSKNKHCSQYFQ